MHVISFRRLREFFAEHADAEAPLKRWFKIADKARWSDFAGLRASCPSADRVGHLIVIDIGGNKYRLIIEVFFNDQVILIRPVLTHQGYDEGEWKRLAPAPGREAARHDDAIEKAPKSGKGRGRDNGGRGTRQ
jgi:mRNA interferase HigB